MQKSTFFLCLMKLNFLNLTSKFDLNIICKQQQTTKYEFRIFAERFEAPQQKYFLSKNFLNKNEIKKAILRNKKEKR